MIRLASNKKNLLLWSVSLSPSVLRQNTYMPTPCYRTRLILDTDSKILLMEMLRAARYTWNECSKVKFDRVKKNCPRELHAAFYHDFRTAHPEIPSQLVSASQRSVLMAYKFIKQQRHELNRPPRKSSLCFQLSKCTCVYKSGKLKITTLGKRVWATLMPDAKLANMFAEHGCSYPELIVVGDEIWAKFYFDVQSPTPEQTLAVGVDLGIRVFAATSEGVLYIDRKYNKEKRGLRYLKRRLMSKARTGSRSAKRRLNKLGCKESNKTKDFCHNLAKRILTETKADVIVLEDLDNSSMKKRTHKYKSKNRISQIPMGRIKHCLTLKAPIYGKTVTVVNPEFTSQIDHQTGERDGVRKGRRYYASSGLIYDADVNAAINIAKLSNLPVSQTSGLTYGQVVANRPIAGHRTQANNWLVGTSKWSMKFFTSWPLVLNYADFSKYRVKKEWLELPEFLASLSSPP